MDALTALHSRRSIRNYTQEAVTEEEIRILLDAAMAAPSAGNAQPWQFVVLDDPVILQRIPSIHPYAGMTPKAPVSILVCGDPDREKHKGFWVQDCAAAVQNLLLAATASGLGAVWTGIYPVEERVRAFRQLLSIPENIIPLALTVIGRPASVEAERKSRFDAAKVHHNLWGKAKKFQ